jgi:hypothetical protein
VATRGRRVALGPREVRAGTVAGKLRRVVPARTAAQASPAGTSAAQAQVRLGIARDSRRLVRGDRARPPGTPRGRLSAALPRMERAGTTVRRESVAARPRARVTDPGGRRVRRKDPGQPARAAASGPRAAPMRTANPEVRPGPRRATGRGGPQPAVTSVGAPGLGAGHAGPLMATAHAAGKKQHPAKTGLRRAVAPAGRASQARRGPPAAATGGTAATGAQVLPGRVLPGRVLPGRARARPTAGARTGAVIRDPVPAVRDPVPAVRQTGHPGVRAA